MPVSSNIIKKMKHSLCVWTLFRFSDRWILCENKTATATNNDSQVAYMVWLWIGADERKQKIVWILLVVVVVVGGGFFSMLQFCKRINEMREFRGTWNKNNELVMIWMLIAAARRSCTFITTNTQDTSRKIQVHWKNSEFTNKIGSKMLAITMRNRIKWL